MLLLNERFTLFEELGMQKIAPMIGLGLVVLDFGYILSIFRMKYQGYPYRWVGERVGMSACDVLYFHAAFCSDELVQGRSIVGGPDGA